MNMPASLSRSALALLLRLLNSPESKISGEVLFDDFSSVGSELIKNGYLEPVGASPIVSSDDGDFSELKWCSENSCYQYFSVGAGWVTVASQDVKRYQLNMDALLCWHKALFGIGSAYRVAALNDSLWYLGASRFGKYKVHIYFSRRLELPGTLKSFLAAMKKESANTPAIVITASADTSSVIEMPLDVAVVPLSNLLSRKDQLVELEHSAVLSLLSGSKVTEASTGGIGLRFSTDYRQVHWNGELYKLTKKQSSVMEALDREGGRAHKDLLRAEAETNEELHRIMRNKVDGKYVTHPLWGTLIQSDGNGYYRLQR